MENCVLYSHYPDFGKIIQIVRETLPKSEIQTNENGINKQLTATIKGGLFNKEKKLVINYRERLQPSYTLEAAICPLTHNLTGMLHFMETLPSQNESVRSKLRYKIQAVNSEIAFMAEPDLAAGFMPTLETLALQMDAFLFASPGKTFQKSASQHFLDRQFNLILDRQGNCEVTDLEVNIDANYFDAPKEQQTEDQLNRKKKSESILKKMGVKINPHLPCISSEKETRIRSVEEIIDRIYALLITAAKGEGVEQQHLERTVKELQIDSFSPEEQVIYQSDKLTDRQRAYATWRYESLNVLMWALGKIEMNPGTTICEVPKLVSELIPTPRESFEKSVTLRSNAEILDELDKTYRMNWACVDAQIKQVQAAGGIEPGVIYERHYALNWLTCYQNQDWDNVQTDT